MIFSFSCIFSAVTLRVELPLLVLAFQGDFSPAYADRELAVLGTEPRVGVVVRRLAAVSTTTCRRFEEPSSAPKR